jgi:hypothetical protein
MQGGGSTCFRKLHSWKGKEVVHGMGYWVLDHGTTCNWLRLFVQHGWQYLSGSGRASRAALSLPDRYVAGIPRKS